MAAGRFHDLIAEALQLSHVVLYDRIEIHVTVHGRDDEHRGLRGHDRRRKHVVCDTTGKLSDDVSRCRCNDEKISPTGQSNMFDIEFRHVVKHGNGDGIATDFPQRKRRDEFRGMFGHDAFHFGSALTQKTGDMGSLEGSDTATDAEDDVLIFQEHGGAPPI